MKKKYEMVEKTEDFKKEVKELKKNDDASTEDEEECIVFIVHCDTFGVIGFGLVKDSILDCGEEEVNKKIVSMALEGRQDIKKETSEFGNFHLTEMNGKIKKQKDKIIPEAYLFSRCKIEKINSDIIKETEWLNGKISHEGESLILCDVIYIQINQKLDAIHNIYHIQTCDDEMPYCSIKISEPYYLDGYEEIEKLIENSKEMCKEYNIKKKENEIFIN